MEADIEGIIGDAKELATAAMTRGSFDFRDMIRGRTYPSLTVPLHVDVELAFQLGEFTERLNQIDNGLLTGGIQPDEVEDLILAVESDRAALIEEIRSRQYTATVQGFSDEDLEELQELALEKYPHEVEDITDELTNLTTQRQKPNPANDKYLSELLWSKAIVQIENGQGDKMDPITVEEMSVLKKSLPPVVRAAVDNAIQRVLLGSQWYKELTDEVFLPRP